MKYLALPLLAAAMLLTGCSPTPLGVGTITTRVDGPDACYCEIKLDSDPGSRRIVPVGDCWLSVGDRVMYLRSEWTGSRYITRVHSEFARADTARTRTNPRATHTARAG